MTFTRKAPRTEGPETGASAAKALDVLVTFFERLDAEGIRYCHWKSNEHLDETMTGDTDVDILVERSAMQPLTRLLNETTNFKRFVVKPGHGYPGIEDYVGFDSRTGSLTHLHIHYQLTLGEKFIKGHRLPWEELFLSTRVLDGTHGVYVTDPHVELLVLIVRSLLKVRMRDVLFEALGYPFFRGGLLQEFQWLTHRIEERRLLEIASRFVGARAAAYLPQILAGTRPTLRQLRAFRRRVEPPLSAYRLYSGLDAARRMAAVEWSIIFWKLRHWILGAPTRSNRTLPQGGIFVVLEGAGSVGVTKLTAAITHWLSRELAVATVPHGSERGFAALSLRLLRKIGAVRSRGWIVFSNTFPSRQLASAADRTGRARVLLPRNRSVLRLVDLTLPDLVIRFQGPAQQGATRQSGDAGHQRVPENEDIKPIDNLAVPHVVTIDARHPLPEQELEAKRAIWEML